MKRGEGEEGEKGVREEGCFVKDMENCVRLLGMFCERDKTGETTHFVVGNILGKSPFLSDMQGSHFIMHTARSHIDIKGLGKAKCLKKMAQKRVVLSLTILLHR